jgi:enterochelin esterase-like enzyme
LIVILLDNMGKRERDLLVYQPFANFLAKESLPDIRRRYPAASHGARRVIAAGSSLGGLAASYCAMMHPEAIDNGVSQSGSYWVGGHDFVSFPIGCECYLPPQFMERERMPIRFYMEAGAYESLLRRNRYLRDVLRTKGYDVTYREFHGAHGYNNWKVTIVDGLGCSTRDWK